MQNQISNALRMGDWVFLGALKNNGFLGCPIDDTIPFDNWVDYLNTKAIYDLFVKSLSLMFGIKAY